MIDYIKLLRPFNLLLIAMVQLLIKFGFLERLQGVTTLETPTFLLLLLATLCIAAAGNVINDIHDLEIDLVNKPSQVLIGKRISEKNAFNLYILLTLTGVGSGFLVANSVGKPGLAAIFIIISALLYIYAHQLKTNLLIGNIVVSLLVACSLLIMILFEIYPAIEESISSMQLAATKAILLYAGFAFYINLLREITKDLTDVNGDKKGGRTTLPIAIGRSRTVTVVFILGLVALLGILAFTYFILYNLQFLAFYFVFLIAGPLLFFCIKAYYASNNKEYRRLSTLLKMVMLNGVISIYFYTEMLTS